MWLAGALDSEASQRIRILCPSSTHYSPKRCLLLIPRFDFGIHPPTGSSPTKPRALGHSQEPLWEEQPVSVWRKAPPLSPEVSQPLPCLNPTTLATFLAASRFVLRIRCPSTAVHAVEKTKLGQTGKLCLSVSIASSPELSRASTAAPLPLHDMGSRSAHRGKVSPCQLAGGHQALDLLDKSPVTIPVLPWHRDLFWVSAQHSSGAIKMNLININMTLKIPPLAEAEKKTKKKKNYFTFQ